MIRADQNESKMMAQFGRAIYDRTSRAVQGKVRFPESSCIFTANTTINDSDSAFVSRMLMISVNYKSNHTTPDPHSSPAR